MDLIVKTTSMQETFLKGNFGTDNKSSCKLVAKLCVGIESWVDWVEEKNILKSSWVHCA